MPIDPVPQQGLLQSLLAQATQRRPYIIALALVSPGGQLWASVLPAGVEADSIAAMTAPAALLGRRIALEQLEGEMRQVYVEGEGGHVILRAIGKEVILLIVATAESNLALVLHDVLQLESHVAEALGITAGEAAAWAQAGPAIERLRRLTSEGRAPGTPPRERLANLRDKLASLDLGYFPERVTAIRERLEGAWAREEYDSIEEIEAELLMLEGDVMALVAPPTETAPRPVEEQPALVAGAMGQEGVSTLEQRRGTRERTDTRGSFIRRALRWLASMIASED